MRHTLAVERRLEDLVDRVDEDEFQLSFRLSRELRLIGLVVARKDDALQAGTLRGERLLANSADGQHLTGERDLARHPDLLRDRLVADERRDRRRDREARRRAVLRNGARGD